MENFRRNNGMLIPTILMGALALVMLYVGYQRGHGEYLIGFQKGMKLLLNMLPLLIFAMIVAGMVQTLLPKEMLARWIGNESGLRGIMVGCCAGALAPGGPFVNLPIAIALLKSGAGVGTMVAFLTGWSLWAIARLPMEFGILGWKFTLIRLASVLLFPPLAGIIAHALFSGVKDF